MKNLYEVAAIILFVAFVLGLVFLFIGTPDLWDRLHEMAMGVCK